MQCPCTAGLANIVWLRPCVQIEEAYIGAEEFCRMLNQDIKAVLNNEVALLQGLQFDLIVHSPYRALAGLFEVCGVAITRTLTMSRYAIYQTHCQEYPSCGKRLCS